MQEIGSFVPANVQVLLKILSRAFLFTIGKKKMKVNIKNIILLIELEQFEEDAKEISKTIRFYKVLLNSLPIIFC